MEIKISEELNSIIDYSRDEAMRTGSYGIAPDHFFLAIVRHKDNTAYDVLKGLDTDMAEFKQFIDSKIFTNEHIPYSDIDQVTFSRGAHNILSIMMLETARLRCREASSEHLLLALLKGNAGYGQTYLRDTGIDYGRAVMYMERNGMLRFGADDGSESGTEEENGNGQKHADRKHAEKNPHEESAAEEGGQSAIDEFGYDLTKAAAEGRLDPVVGRENEISRVIQILGRRKKNNPMLVGEPGVGKSAIVEGIAMKIVSGDVSPVLAGKRLVSLDIASVVAGTKYRGDFEKRLKAIINESAGNPDIILFIDEFHTIVGAGSAAGSLDAANMLKPALARGDIQCIGATTLEEFRKTVEKDGALDRRFQKIVIEPCGTEESIAILEKLKENYEKHHNVRYTPEAIRACVTLSERYINDRSLPDKAIDAMDEAGSMVKLTRRRKNQEVTEDDIATIISEMTGIPVNKVAESEGNRLLKMRKGLKSKVIGQDEAIDTIVKAIQRNRAGIKDPGKPIGTFMFLGPTGVGKTRLAKVLAEYLFDSSENIVRVDMSEYMEKFTVSRLIGAPPGYVGFEEGGQLSEKVRRKPYCVVLLDEIEKAHPDIFNLLLQVLDEGRLTDSNGRTVSFRNTVIIMTSNIGSREIEEYGSGLGFSTASTNIGAKKKMLLEKTVRKSFPPEFINRIDELIHFNPLGRDSIEKIIDIELEELKQRVKEEGFVLKITPAARHLIADAGYDPAFGARPLKKAVRKYVEDPVSEFILGYRVLSGKKAAAKRNGQPENGADRTITIGVVPGRDMTEVRIKE